MKETILSTESITPTTDASQDTKVDILPSSSTQLHPNPQKKELPGQCSVCGKTFKFPSLLKMHTMKHAVEKSYCCDVCGKQFSQLDYLNMHMTVHRGEKPHSCNLCGEKFWQFR